MLKKFLFNGKEIDLTGDNVVIKSSNFNVNKNGNMTCSNANITGGKISLKDNGANDVSDARLLIEKANDASRYAYFTSNQIYIGNGGRFNVQIGYDCTLSLEGESGSSSSIGDDTLFISMPGSSAGALSVLGGNTYVRNLQYSNISQFSLEELKKNIVKLNENAIDIVNNSELYIFNYKEENDTDKKHIGFVIGEKYKTPKQIISKDNKGIDLANMSAILWKAIQELAQKNELLEKRIELLEKEEKNG